MKNIHIVFVFLLLLFAMAACSPSLGQMQRSLSAYHVVTSTTGDGVVEASSEVVGLYGQAGTALRITAPILPGGGRGIVLERVLDQAGTMAWRIVMRTKGDEDWIRLERMSCAVARAALAELPDCGPAAADIEPEVVEKRIYR
jgi:hypothetical protein